MKSPLLFILLILGIFSIKVNAQYVSIPDSSFGSWLFNNGYSACMTGSYPNYQLDTTCNGVLFAQTMECSNQGIHNLTGIQYFKTLKTLVCKLNNLDSLGELPNSITNLDCSFDTLRVILAFPSQATFIGCSQNLLASIPAIPSGITDIDCSQNRLTHLPVLPPNLGTLSCGQNWLVDLPALPTSLGNLDCSNNFLDSIPSILPPALYSLSVSYNTLHVLPALPATLLSLYCSSDSLSSLPVLPAGLSYLNCISNQLTSLPILPSTLTALFCNINQLTSLPILPAGLGFINCSYNQLVSLPTLPDSLTGLDCSNNINLACLPELKRIGALDFSNTAVTCLPSYGSVGTSTPLLSSLPLCGIFNPNGCNVAYNLSGQAYHDVNSNCLLDSSDVGTGNIKVMLYNNGVLQQQYFTGQDGYYSFNVNNVYGTYAIQLDTTLTPFTVNCPSSGAYVDTLSALDSIFNSNDFALNCKQGFDVGVFNIVNDLTVVPRPASIVPVYITAGDLANQYHTHCSSSIGGQVQVVFSGQATYQGVATGALTPSNVSGDTITWAIPDFSTIINDSAFNIILQIDTTATAGSQICFAVNVTPTTGDNNPVNNTLNYCFTVVNALDPNEKEVYPAGNIDTTQGWLTYTIRFQNTGNAPALNIYVLDTLSSNLDVSSIQLLSASHKNVTQVLDPNILRFNFPNINLPDSTTDEPNSHGYVRYKIKLKHGLPYGTTINNTANIYFDLNPAVVTNTVTSTLARDTVQGIINTSLPNDALAVTLFPNPTSNLLNIAVHTKGTYTIRLLDISGAEVMAQTTANTVTTIDLSSLSKGMYFVEVRSNGLVTRKKVVKM